MKMLRRIGWGLALVGSAPGHDTWVETNVRGTEQGQPVHVALMLGNHGNDHRDFKLAAKIPLEGSTLEQVGPEGATNDLKPDLADRGLDPKEGFWSVRLLPDEVGIHEIRHTYDAVVSYAPKRAVKSAKVFFRVGATGGGLPEPAGHPFELLPLEDPTAAVAGSPFRVKLLFKGEPLSETVVSAVPEGGGLSEGFDPDHEVRTDADGVAALPLPEPNHYLIVAHHAAPDEKGDGYDATSYAATLTLRAAAP